MRFGNGAWRMLPGVNPIYLGRVDALRIEGDAIVLHVSNRLEEARWAVLEGHMFTVRLSSPANNVVRVQVSHYLGRKDRTPGFELNATPRGLKASETEDTISADFGQLRVTVTRKPFGITFADAQSGAVITESPFKGLGMMHMPDGSVYMRDQHLLRVGEYVYGLGERFQTLTRNGQTVDMWNDDCGTCSDKGYKDVPFYLTSRGYGVMVNTPARVSFEIGTEQVMRTQFGVPGHDLDYYFIYGPTPKQTIERLGALAGRPALPPVWSFGLWLTTSFTTDYDENTVMEHLDGMRDRELPLHVFHFDCFWMKGHHWCNFQWDEDQFPDPAGMLERLKRRGLRICVWINPYIGERSDLFAEGAERGYLLKRPNGDVYQRDRWQAGMAYVDFTNAGAVAWYQDKLRELLDMGVDCFKTDFGEEIATDVAYHDGSDPVAMHNYYTYLYNRAVFELLERERGKGEALVFARSATMTCQQFPVHWGGDCYGTFESMAESLRGGLSLGACGFGYWSHDIGGFESKASPAVYKRWVAFGLLSSHSRLHGSTSYRVPWTYDDEAVDVVRHFTGLKCRLMPYLWQLAHVAHETSLPMTRAMLLEFPDDPTCRTLDRQYMLGDALLVAPVFDESRAEYYLPEGDWVHLLTGEKRSGGRWFFDACDFFELPLWLRPGHTVALGTSTNAVDYDHRKDVRLVVGAPDTDGEQQITVAANGEQAGDSFSISHTGKRTIVECRSGRTDFEVHLPWCDAVSALSGAERADLDAKRPGDTAGVLLRATASRVTLERAG